MQIPKSLIVLLISVSSTLAADPIENPLYKLWPADVGTKVHFERVMRISGGIPTPMGEERVHNSTVTYQLDKATPTELTITVNKHSFTIPAKLAEGDKRLPKQIGNEEIKFGDRTYNCQIYTYQTSVAEAGSQPTAQGFPAVDITVWVTPEVSGGVLRRRMTYLEKASYEIEDTYVSTIPPKGKGP